MGYVGLSRKYRPQNFKEVIGQGHITQTLENALKTNSVSHAYLFSGPRGVGKTSTARILAKSLNCEKGPTPEPCSQCFICKDISRGSSMDVLEIDAASNRGIDEIRDLREKVKFTPAQGKYRIYIIDEVHMLTTEAFNALLKTLEEPPAHVVFVLATTRPHKIPLTIISRCQWFSFKRISAEEIARQLLHISEKEDLSISEKSSYAIARHAEGSLRDALVSLDQLSSFSGKIISDEDVLTLLGIIREDFLHSFIHSILEKKVVPALKAIEELFNQGYEMEEFINQLEQYLRNLIILKAEGLLTEIPKESVEKLGQIAKGFSQHELLFMLDIIASTRQDLREFGNEGQEKLILEIMAIKLANRDLEERTGSKVIQKSITNEPERKENVNAPAGEKTDYVANAGQETEKALNLQEIKECWPMVIKKVKEKRISLGAFLQEGVPQEIKNNLVTVGLVSYARFHQESLEKRENKQFIEEILGETLKNSCKIKFVLNEKSKDAPLERKEEKSPAGREKTEQSLEEEPIVKKAAKILEARIVERRRK